MKFDQSNNGRRAMRWVLVAGLAIGGAANAADPKMDATKGDAAAAPAAKPDKNALKNSQAAVQAAVSALQKEVLAHKSDPKTALREKCDYFTENPSKDVLPETIVAALASTISPDAPSDSYIKWQLLSGAPAKFDEALARQAAAAYMKAAKPITRPGLSVADKKQLDPLTASVRNADESMVVTKKLSDLVDAWEERNKPVVAYRDELYARLPALMPEGLVARFDDLTQRVEAGYPGEATLTPVITDITKWVDTNPPAVQLYVMAERVKTLVARSGGKPVANNNNANNTGGMRNKYTYNNNNTGAGGMNAYAFPPKYYNNVEFDSKYNKWKWADIAGRMLRGEVLTDLEVTLEDAAKTAKTAAAKDMAKK